MADLAGSQMAFDQAAGWVGRISNEYFLSWAGFELARGLYEAASLAGDDSFSGQADGRLARIPNPYFRLLARCEMAKHLLSTGKKKEARELAASLEKEARSLDKEHSKASALSECADLRARLGDLKGCEKDLAESEGIARSIDNTYFRSWALSGLIRASARIARETGDARHFNKYRPLLSEIEDKYLEAWAWAELARTLCTLEDGRGCRKALESALAAARAVADPVNAALGLTEAALAALDNGNRKLAEEALSETERRMESAKDHQRALVCSEVARMTAAFGDTVNAKRRVQGAIDISQPVTYEHFRAWALSGVVRALVSIGVRLAKK